MMNLLLQTKLAVPIIRDRLVLRSRVYQQLEAGLLRNGVFQRKLTLVTAPAGYGKTTLVASWLRSTKRPFTWLALDESDNDLSRFLSYLIASLKSIGIGDTAYQVIQSTQMPPAEAIVSILMNDIEAASQIFSLVLDDYHTINQTQIHKIISFFLEHQSPKIHLVVITREDPLLPVPRLLSRGQAIVIRQDDLRFSLDETKQFLCEFMNLNLSHNDVTSLEQRTEGWIAGLQLAALAMQGLAHHGVNDFKTFIDSFAGNNRYVIDYLISEVFQQQPIRIQEFLIKTSILKHVNGPLCDQVTKQTGSQTVLHQLEQANLFLIPLDQTGEWFRYHHLFAGFLRHRLHVNYPLEIKALHGSASRWYEANGLLSEAIEHALSAEDWDRSGYLIDLVKDLMLRQGNIQTLLSWYHRLPEEFIQRKPKIFLGYTWPLVLSGQLNQAETVLSIIEPNLEEGSIDQGNFYAVQAFIARSKGDYAAVISSSKRALELLEKTNPASRGTIKVNLGIAFWHNGQLDETESTMSEVQQIATQTDNKYAALTARFFRTRVLACRGLLRKSEAMYLSLIEETGQNPIKPLLFYDLCTLYHEWNRLEEAEKYLNLGMETSLQVGSPEFISAGHILGAFLHIARKDYQAASREADQAVNLSFNLPPGVRARSEALQVSVNILLGNLEQAGYWAEQMQSSADPHPLYRFLDLTKPRLLLAQGNKETARKLLADLSEQAKQNGWGYGQVATQILQSLASPTMDEAIGFIRGAMDLSNKEGFIGSFINAGPDIAPVLQETARRGIYPEYSRQILAAYGLDKSLRQTQEFNDGNSSYESTQFLSETLSHREMEVLHLVVAGFSNREIARQLIVTPGTAKTHIHNIFGKLGVRNRTEAAIRAKELHLV